MSGRDGLNSRTAKSQSHSVAFQAPGMVRLSARKLPKGAVGAAVFAPNVMLLDAIQPFWKKQCAAHKAVLGPIIVAVQFCGAKCAFALPGKNRGLSTRRRSSGPMTNRNCAGGFALPGDPSVVGIVFIARIFSASS